MGIFHGPHSPSRPLPAPRAPPPGTGRRWPAGAPVRPARAQRQVECPFPPPLSWALQPQLTARFARLPWQLLPEGVQGQSAVATLFGRCVPGAEAAGWVGSPGHAGSEVVAVPAGGWYCFNRENCDSRFDTMRRLMSSRDWPRTRTGQQGTDPPRRPHLGGKGWGSWGSQLEVLEEAPPSFPRTRERPHPIYVPAPFSELLKVRKHNLSPFDSFSTGNF